MGAIDRAKADYGIHSRRRLLSRAFQTLRHRTRASLAASPSSAMSSPATKARFPVAFAERSQACAVTLSWCSPRIVCSLAAALANAFQQDLTVADGAESHREPTQLRAQRLRPLGVEKRTERAQVGPQLARGDASLVYRLWITARPHQRVVMEKRSNGLGDRISDHVLSRRVRCERLR